MICSRKIAKAAARIRHPRNHRRAPAAVLVNPPGALEFSTQPESPKTLPPGTAHGPQSPPLTAGTRSVSVPGRWAWILLLISLSCQAMGAVEYPLRWRWSNPFPHGGNVVDMAYNPALFLAVQVAELGQIYTSDDLDVWIPRESNTTKNLRAVTFFGARIVITGEAGTVLHADNPNSFQPGTLMEGPTSDWLESVAAGNGLVAVGDNGAVYTSGNGVQWRRQFSGVTNWLRGVAFGGGVFVAVGEQGTIITSPTGTSWTKRNSGSSQHLNRVSFAGNRFTAVGEVGTVLMSSNLGANWYPDAPGASNALQYAASDVAAGQERLVTGDHEVRINYSGGWSNELARSNGPASWSYYTALARPNYFLIAGQTALQSEGFQAEGSPFSWLDPFPSIRNWLWDVVFATNLYVTVGDFGTVMTSPNGVDWTLELVPPSVTNVVLLGVGGSTNLLVAAGSEGRIIVSRNNQTNLVITNASGTVVTQVVSSLGVVWEAVLSPTTNALQGVAAWGTNLYLVTGGRGTVLISPNGSSWFPRSAPTTNLLTGAASWPGGFVATGDDGIIITSSNGITWTKRTSNTSNWLYRVRYLNGVFITVGQNGIILTSTNGGAWTKRTSGTTEWLNDVTFIDGTWFIVGTHGTVLVSSNLTAWTSIGTITRKSLYGVATDSRQLVSVGLEGAILRSQVVPDRTPLSILSYARVMPTNQPLQNVFLFGGKPDQRFTLDYRSHFGRTNWITGASLEIVDGSGTLYYVETLFGTNRPAAEFYRATLPP